jgi:hypothetical protein
VAHALDVERDRHGWASQPWHSPDREIGVGGVVAPAVFVALLDVGALRDGLAVDLDSGRARDV